MTYAIWPSALQKIIGLDVCRSASPAAEAFEKP
jgi:hypothetical protein